MSGRVFLAENSYYKFKKLLTNKKKKIRAHNIFKNRHFGEFYQLYSELRKDEKKFFDYYRMLPSTFDYILHHIKPNIEKCETNFLKPISPEERLSVTLR